MKKICLFMLFILFFSVISINVSGFKIILDTTATYGGDNCFGVWANDTYIFMVSYEDGLTCQRWYHYTNPPATTVGYFGTAKDYQGKYRDVWGQDGYLFVAAEDDGLLMYKWGVPNGNFTLLDQDNSSFSEDCRSVWGDGTYIYVSGWEDDLYCFSYNSTSLIHEDTIGGGYTHRGVFGANDYIFVSSKNALVSYSFSGGSFTREDEIGGSSNFFDVYANEDYVFASALDDGVFAFSYDDNGQLTSITSANLVPEVAYVWEEDGFVFCSHNDGNGMTILYFDGSTFTSVNNTLYGNNVFEGVYFTNGRLLVSDYQQGGGVYVYEVYQDPNAQTNESTDVEEEIATLNGYIDNNGSVGDLEQKINGVGFYIQDNENVGVSDFYQNLSVSGTYVEGDEFTTEVCNLNSGQLYFIRAWVKNRENFTESTNTQSFLTKPQAPENVSTTVINSSAMNISWSKSPSANNTVLVRKTSGMPTTYTDGEVLYNGTGEYFVVSDLNSGDIYYYRLWSYSEWSNPNYYQYSDNNSDVSVGGIVINVYDENTSANITDWNVFVSNPLGTEVYNASNCNNFHTINVTDCPLGTDISFLISANGYQDRIYYKDILANAWYSLDAYLPEEAVSHQYTLRVEDEFGNRIEDAFIKILEYDNISGIYQSVTTGYSDANGEIQVFLYPSIQYKLNISKMGYVTLLENEYRPDPIYYGIYYPKIFKLVEITASYDTVWDDLTYSVEPEFFDHYENFTMFFNLSVEDNSLEWFKITVLLKNDTSGEWDALYSYNESNLSNGGSLSYTSIGNGSYGLQCSFKRVGFDIEVLGSPHSDYKFVYTLWSFIDGAGEDLDTIITGIVGESPVYVGNEIVEYTSLIVCICAIFILFSMNSRTAGLFIMGLGLMLIFFREPLNLLPDARLRYSAAVVIIILGFITWIIYKKENK